HVRSGRERTVDRLRLDDAELGGAVDGIVALSAAAQAELSGCSHGDVVDGRLHAQLQRISGRANHLGVNLHTGRVGLQPELVDRVTRLAHEADPPERSVDVAQVVGSGQSSRQELGLEHALVAIEAYVNGRITAVGPL